MKKYKYEDITIEQAERIMGTGYINELICDADNKTININEEDFLKVEEAIKETINNVKKAIELVVDTFVKVFNELAETAQQVAITLIELAENLIKNLSNKKMTKRKFMKLLQSNGIQRNEIQETIKNNTKEYNYLRYYDTLDKFKKRRKV